MRISEQQIMSMIGYLSLLSSQPNATLTDDARERVSDLITEIHAQQSREIKDVKDE